MVLKDKVAIITGASRGIGAAVARNLNGAGMKLVIAGRDADALSAVAAGLNDSVSVVGDITAPEMPAKLIAKAVQAFGQCHVVFNNAGVMQLGPTEKTDIDKICEMVRINTEAGFRMAYTAVKYFRSVGGGHLMSTSSVLGTKVRPGGGAYAGTKFAIEALSEALRMELAQTGVKVSCIEPGIVETNLCDHLEVHPKKVFNVKKALDPDDIARSVRFILEQPDHVLIPRLLILPAEQGI